MADDDAPQDDPTDPMRALAKELGQEPPASDEHRHTGGTWVEPRFDADMTEYPAAIGDLDADGAAALEPRPGGRRGNVDGLPLASSPFGVLGRESDGSVGMTPPIDPDPGHPHDGGTRHPSDPSRPD